MQLPTMTHVKSSNVHSIGHGLGPDGKEGSYVTFKNKVGEPVSTYFYHGVTADKHAEFAAAESPNGHLGQHIKPHHEYTKLDAVHAAKDAETT